MQVVLILRWPSAGNWGLSVRGRTRDEQITRLLELNQKLNKRLLTKNSTQNFWAKTFDQQLNQKLLTKTFWPKTVDQKLNQKLLTIVSPKLTFFVFPRHLTKSVAKLAIQRIVVSILNHEIWGRFHDTCVYMWVLIKEKNIRIFLEYIYCHTAGEKGKVKYLEVNM